MSLQDEEKWQLINATETYEELASVIMIIAEDGVIRSNRQDKTFDAARQARNAHLVINEGYFPNILTRAFGIRQQALYIRYYEQKERELYGSSSSDDLTDRAGSGSGTCADSIQADSADGDGRIDQGGG